LSASFCNPADLARLCTSLLPPAERCVQLSPGPAAGESEAEALQWIVQLTSVMVPSSVDDGAPLVCLAPCCSVPSC
jgi:hypothetical protein